MCPSQVTCAAGLVLCPDNSCVTNAKYCVQSPSGLPSKLGSCGPTNVRCPNGECSTSCETQIATNCTALGQVQCPGTFQCASSYEACPTGIYCPLVSNYTYKFKAVICDSGPQICTWDNKRCKKSACQSQINYFSLTTAAKPWSAYDPSLLRTCSDGRCNQFGCMTQVSCSSGYEIKSQILGYFCTSQTSEADEIAELAYTLQALFCPENMVTCLSGHCRPSVADCPQSRTCPTQLPVMCQDGLCVSDKEDCEIADIIAHNALQICKDQNLLLCTSDLKTCVTSVEQCPTMSTCPFGYTKCLENKCVLDWQCTIDVKICDSSAPLYCKSKDQCVASISACPSLTVCPAETPVKCASDQTCQKTFAMCPPQGDTYTAVPFQTITVPVQEPVCNSPRFFKCDNGDCDFECDEWASCPSDDQIQCADGRCVTDSNLCPVATNGCPFHLPVFCSYQAKCVTGASQCYLESNAIYYLNQTCARYYGSDYAGCPLGNCAQVTTGSTITEACEAQNSTVYEDQCASYQYPNDAPEPEQCYVWQCSQEVPYKCPNGLCVSEAKYCPVIQYSAAQINTCQNLSDSTGFDIRFPCADGNCVSEADQCKPLYNCSYNLNGRIKRCNDGTCVSQRSLCPQGVYDGCPYRCWTGQCADDKTQCLMENGCSVLNPYRCEYNGVCMTDLTGCWNSTSILQRTSLSPATPSDNICEGKGLFTCISDSMMMYCATNLSRCYQVQTGCPVAAPVLCGGWCVQSVSDCAQVTQPKINHQGCSTEKPFRCSNLFAANCAELPFSSDENLYNYTCSATIPSLVGKYPINKCSSSLSPYSCADGSCVANLGDCQSCPNFCLQMMGCTATPDECADFGVLKAQSRVSKYIQQCPVGTPIRCVLTGTCVANAVACTTLVPTAYSQSYTGQLLDATCPSDQPIRCIDGSCADSYIMCMQDILMSEPQMTSPIAWNATISNGNLPCQVYCPDGSCRDRQQNCPLAQACLSPEKPFRCMNGLCAKDLNTCIQQFGVGETDSRGSDSAYCLKLYGTDYNLDFVKCEDGTCRPATFIHSTSTYQTTCLPHMGCPLSAAFQCSTGQCVTQLSNCLTYSNTALCQGYYMCKNMACVSDPVLCNINLSLLPVLQLEVTVNTFEVTSVFFVYNDTYPIAGLTLPAGSVPLDTSTDAYLSYDSLQKMRINPVPTQGQYLSSVNSDSIDYAAERYTLVDSKLTSDDAMLGPMFEIVLDQDLTQDAILRFVLDLPTAMDLVSDVCLAEVQSDGETLTCISRDITQTDDGWLTVLFRPKGSPIAVIFNPDMSLKTSTPTPLVPTPIDVVDPGLDESTLVEPVTITEETCDTIWCQYKWWIIFGSIGVFILIIAVVLVCCYLKGRSTQQSEAQAQYQRKPPTSAASMHNEVLLTEAEVEDKINKEREKTLRLVQDDFRQMLKQRDRKIEELEHSVKEMSQHQHSEMSKSPMSKNTVSPDLSNELRDMSDRMQQHYRSEVQRLAADFQKDAERSGLTPPRNFVRADMDMKLQPYQSEEENNWMGPYRGRFRDKYNYPTSATASNNKPSDWQLSDQWNKLVHEYRPPKELLSQTSRPYLGSQSDIQKSTKSNQVDRRPERPDNGNDSAIYKPRRKQLDRVGPSSQTEGIKPKKRL